MASFDPTTTLLVMALKEESQGLFENAGFQPLYTGIGQAKATTNLMKALEKTNPTSIVNLGTAGSFHLQQGECVECLAFVQRHNLLEINSPKIFASTPLTGLKKVVCGTADSIQKKTDAAGFSSNHTYEIMDMEAYAIAALAQQKKIPFNSIKVISDNSDDSLVLDWKKNLRSSAEKLLQIYKNILNP